MIVFRWLSEIPKDSKNIVDVSTFDTDVCVKMRQFSHKTAKKCVKSTLSIIDIVPKMWISDFTKSIDMIKKCVIVKKYCINFKKIVKIY